MIRSFAIPVCLCLCATSLYAQQPQSFHRMYPGRPSQAMPTPLTYEYYPETQQPAQRNVMQTSGGLLAEEMGIVRLGEPTPATERPADQVSYVPPTFSGDIIDTYAPPPMLPPGYEPATFSAGWMPHFSWLDYGEGSRKNDGKVGGVYLYFYDGNELCEFNYSATKIHYNNGTLLDQDNYAYISTDFFEGYKTRWGTNVWQTNIDQFQGFTLLGGLYLTEQNSYDLGFDFYISHYDDHPADQLTVVQYSPHWQHIIYTNEQALVKWDLLGHWINFSEDNFVGDWNQFSVEFRLGAVWGKWEIGGYVWGGEQTYAVRNDGFVVYNLHEQHKSGYGIELKRSLPMGFQLIGRAARENYDEIVTGADSTMDIYSVLLMWSI